MFSRLSRPVFLVLCAVPVVALFAVVVLAPLPYAIAAPGLTADVLGVNKRQQVITITQAPTRRTTGQLRMTTIEATGPSATVRIADVVKGWFRPKEAVLPRDSVYPAGQSVKEINRTNTDDMVQSQNDAVSAALTYLHKDPKSVDIKLHLADVGGPSAGLLFTLGIIDKLNGNGSGGDLTGGRIIAGTGTIDGSGSVGEVGGVALKTQAASRSHATVFLVPRGECSQAKVNLPKNMRLVPVTTLKGAVSSLNALQSGGKVPSC